MIIIFSILGCKTFLTTPEGTIHYFMKSLEENDINAANSCFKGRNFEKAGLGKAWLDYKIIKKVVYDENKIEEYKKVNKYYNYNIINSPKIGDVEIIVREKIESEGKIKNVNFRYLLRRFEDKWFIIENYALDNELN